MNKKILFLFANEYPFGDVEPFLESEVPYYNRFDKVCIFSLQLRKKKAGTRRDIPLNAIAYPIFFNPFLYILFAFLKTPFDKNFYKELLELNRRKKLSIRTFIQLVVYVSRSHYEAGRIIQIAKKEASDSDCITYYAYRFGYQPYVACLVEKKIGCKNKIISRAHGYDLYENRKKSNYIPMRRIILEKLDFCFPCSIDGTQYLKDLYPEYSEKIETKYLGTKCEWSFHPKKRGKEFRIVSCSHVVQLKRLDLIIEALSQLGHICIKWTHFGDGPLLEELKNKSKSTIPQTIEVDWKGKRPNSEVLNAYKTEDYDLFLNTSMYEGLPVSIMEAMSYGIPCVATNAGGTKEIVSSGFNGVLLNLNTSAKEIALTIERFYKMNSDEFRQYSLNARRTWEDFFNCEANYKKFVEEILS